MSQFFVRCARLYLAVLLLSNPPMLRAQNREVRVHNPAVRVGNQTFQCHVVTLDLASGRLVPRVVIARGGVGRTEAFEAMVKSSRAVAAINGSFFDAYNPAGDNDPGMTLIRNGQVVHKGGTGTVIGFAAGKAIMGRLDLPIRGMVESGRGQKTTWYAYWLNRTPTSPDNIAVFTPARGARTRVRDGISIVVRNGIVEDQVPGDAAIPINGFVLHLRGTHTTAARLFPRGARVGYQVIRRAGPDSAKWEEVTEAVGAGPRLVADGAVAYDPLREGFSSPKILSNGGQRSAIGILRNGKLLLVTAAGPTVRQLADIMRNLGAVQAMNLDGGASSALYAGGVYLTRPGRLLSNALVFTRP